MKKRYVNWFFAVLISAGIAASSISVFAADADDFIAPWNTTYNFDAKADLSYTNTGAATYNVPSMQTTYTNLYMLNAGCSVDVRDSYTDSEDNKVYDNTTQTPGNKYLRISSQGNNVGPGIFMMNYVSSSKTDASFNGGNGGLVHGKAVYEFDYKLEDIKAATYTTGSSGGIISIYGYNAETKERIELIRIPVCCGSTETFYPAKLSDADKQSYGSLDASMGSVKANEWAHFKITFDAAKQTARLDLTARLSKTGNIVAQSQNITLPAKNSVYPALTTLSVRGPIGTSTYIDNLSVTKETFLVDDSETVIDDSTANVTAAVKAACDVRTSDGVESVSPTAILALFDKDNTLIGVDLQTIEFEEYSKVFNQSDYGSLSAMQTARGQFFTTPVEYKELVLSAAKPEGYDHAAVYVWKNMDEMIPYTDGIEKPAN